MKGYLIGRDADGLTERERQVVQLLVAGLGPSAVARRLGVSRQRVTGLLKSLAAKGVVERTDDGVLLTITRRFRNS